MLCEAGAYSTALHPFSKENCSSDVASCTLKVLARPWINVRVCHLHLQSLCLYNMHKNVNYTYDFYLFESFCHLDIFTFGPENYVRNDEFKRWTSEVFTAKLYSICFSYID